MGKKWEKNGKKMETFLKSGNMFPNWKHVSKWEKWKHFSKVETFFKSGNMFPNGKKWKHFQEWKHFQKWKHMDTFWGHASGFRLYP